MENTLIINKNLRTITIPESVKNLGVESDDDVLRLQFTMPKTYGEIDLSAFNIRINYTNAAGEGDVYPVVDNAVAGDNITFSWLVGRFATKAKGNVKFNVCLRELDEAGEVAREFNTTPAMLPVLEGLETTGAVVQQNPDILEEMQSQLAGAVKTVNGTPPDKNGNVQVETGGGSGGAIVINLKGFINPSETETEFFLEFNGVDYNGEYKSTFDHDYISNAIVNKKSHIELQLWDEDVIYKRFSFDKFTHDDNMYYFSHWEYCADVGHVHEVICINEHGEIENVSLFAVQSYPL